MSDAASPLTRGSPGAGRALSLPGGRLTIVPAPPAARYSLRCRPEHTGLLGRAFGVPLPVQACRVGRAGHKAALWLGPDEWLLLAEDGAQAGIEAGFASVAATTTFSLVDVSHRHAAVRLDGPAAEAVLSAGCPLDLHVTAFAPDTCARTLFGKCEVVLWRTQHGAFRMEFARSYADYVWSFLEAACTDIGS